MARSISIILLAGTAFIPAVCQVHGGDRDEVRVQNGPVIFTASRTTPLKAILRLTSERRIPLGIVFGTGPALCTERTNVRVDAPDVGGALDQILSQTGYTFTQENQVYVLRAPDQTSHEIDLLGYRFDRFSATNTTMSEAGALLAGYISTVAEGAGGFAIHSASSPSTKTFSIKMQFATTTEIANRIVSQNGKGVWTFHPTPDRKPESDSDPPVEVFGYSENAASLDFLKCVADAKPAK